MWGGGVGEVVEWDGVVVCWVVRDGGVVGVVRVVVVVGMEERSPRRGGWW